jgi:hypothetical protein
MRHFLLVMLTVSAAGFAQDGLYGSFTLGKKFIDMQPLNDALNSANVPVAFASDQWILGGEGHMIVAKHFLAGGKGFVTLNNPQKFTDADGVNGEMKMTGILAMATLGYSFNAGRNNALRLYPLVGGGVTTVILQNKAYLHQPSTADTSFADVISNREDYMSVIQKVGAAIDLGLGFDYFLEFIELKALIPGLVFGPMFHIDAAYTFTPGNLRWMRDVDNLADFHPDITFKGFYFNAGIGIGLSSTRD